MYTTDGIPAFFNKQLATHNYVEIDFSIWIDYRCQYLHVKPRCVWSMLLLENSSVATVAIQIWMAEANIFRLKLYC